jgi:hypothetical protein
MKNIIPRTKADLTNEIKEKAQEYTWTFSWGD